MEGLKAYTRDDL